MKQFTIGVLAVVFLASTASARYILVPLEDVEFVDERVSSVRRPRSLPEQRYVRFARSPFPEDEPVPQSNRREELSPELGSFIVPASLRSEIEPHTSASTYSQAPGPDYVDYGAYTGGYGSFGWYTDHPVVLSGHH